MNRLLAAHISSKIAVIAAILAACVVYLAMLFILRAVDGEDIKLLPKGQKIYAIMHRLKLVK